MKLEEEIKQKKFKSEFQKLAVNIIFTHGWLVNKHSEILKRYNISIQQYNILRILRGQYPNVVCLNLIKERMLEKTPDISRLVERLKQKGLLERTLCGNDRRKVDVVISKKGLDLLEKMESIDEENNKIFSKLSEEEAKSMNNLLDKARG